MLQVAICDNNDFYRKRIADLALKAMFDAVEISFVYYETGIQLLDDVFRNAFHADLLLIDIELPQIDGMKTVQMLRRFGIDSDIIFVTEAIEYSLEGYRYGVYDFIPKPISVLAFEQVMLRYIKEKIEKSDEFLQIPIRGTFYKINLKHVMYFESAGRTISCVGLDDEITFYLKMDELEKILQEKHFVRIHQSYLVNSLYVVSGNKGKVTLTNGMCLPVSKRYTNTARQFFE